LSEEEWNSEELGPIEERRANWQGLDGKYSDEHRSIADWLMIVRRPAGVDGKEFTALKRNALRYLVVWRQLYYRGRRDSPHRQVIDNPEEQKEIIRALHDERGHKGRESTAQQVRWRYYWDGYFNDVAKWVKECPECQKSDMRTMHEGLGSTKIRTNLP
jgi:hypothetical protein